MRVGMLVGALVVALGAASCAPEPPPPPTVVELTVNFDAGANPDVTGRASPVTLYVYDLKSDGGFNQSDFFQLTGQPQAALGADLLASQQVAGAPGTSQTVTTEVPNDTRFVGVVAGYRDIDQAVWRAVAPVSPNTTNKLTATVGPLAVSLN